MELTEVTSGWLYHSISCNSKGLHFGSVWDVLFEPVDKETHIIFHDQKGVGKSPLIYVTILRPW